MNKRDALLIDLDGTVYRGKTMIPYADRFVKQLKQDGVPYLFVTNNSSRTPEAVAEHLREMGIDASAEDVYTAAQAAAQYIAEHQPGARIALIGETGLDTALRAAGLNVLEMGAEQPDYVVQGIDRSFSYGKLAHAVRAIREGAAYVLTNPDLLLPTDEGLVPGAGTLSASIRAASGVEPVIIGKPSNIIMRYAMERLGSDAKHTIVIGDNMLTDIAAGYAADCRTVLVMTGITTEDNYRAMAEQAGCEPDVTCADLEALSVYISETIRQ